MASAAGHRFGVGDTVVRRDTIHGRVWTAAPHRVVWDRGDELQLVYWPGIRSLAPTTWISWLRTGDVEVRRQAVPNLAAGRWELGWWTWRDTVLLSRFGVGEYFSVHTFFDQRESTGWYVNVERPYQRTSIGIDTFDLLLDLEVAPDLSSYSWKDEDEYAHGRRLGLVDDTTHRHLEQARDEVVALVEAGRPPFCEDWSGWLPSPDWPVPTLPDDSLTIPT